MFHGGWDKTSSIGTLKALSSSDTVAFPGNLQIWQVVDATNNKQTTRKPWTRCGEERDAPLSRLKGWQTRNKDDENGVLVVGAQEKRAVYMAKREESDRWVWSSNIWEQIIAAQRGSLFQRHREVDDASAHVTLFTSELLSMISNLSGLIRFKKRFDSLNAIVYFTPDYRFNV